MANKARFQRMISAYILFRQAPRSSKRADALARRYHEARRHAIRDCGAGMVIAALGTVTHI